MTDSKSPVLDLAAWLGRIWDEEEKAAQSVVDRYAPDEASIYLEDPWPEEAAYLPYAKPASALARIAADRKILALHHPDRVLENWYWSERRCEECGQLWHGGTPIGTPPTLIGPELGCRTVRLLAEPHADKPGFRPEWLVERQGVEQ